MVLGAFRVRLRDLAIYIYSKEKNKNNANKIKE
jgi:hypothetical protein